MERTVALKKLRSLLGNKLGYRVDPRAPSREEREAAREQVGAIVTKRNELKEQTAARIRAILAADPEYQRLKDEHDVAQKELQRIGDISRHYKITVGISNELFFSIKAEGDSWEEVIAKLQTRKAA